MGREPEVPLPDWLNQMLPRGCVRHRIDAGGYGMSVMELGRGRPVLLLHGNPTWGFLYRKVMTALAGEPLRLIAPDLIGLGFSDKPRQSSAHQLENHAKWLGSVIEALDLHGLICVGHDWGGPIGMRALFDLQDRVCGLVLLNTAVSPPRKGFRQTAFHRFSRMPIVSDLAFRVFGFPQNALSRVQGNPQSIRGAVARAYRYPLRGLRDRVAPLALARMVPNSFEHPSIAPLRRCQEFVERFDGPSAIVWGDRDPILGRARRRVETLLPQAEITRTEAGHFLQEEVPEKVAAAIRSVARRV